LTGFAGRHSPFATAHRAVRSPAANQAKNPCWRRKPGYNEIHGPPEHCHRAELPAFDSGWVWLGGRRAGRSCLITALGLHALAHADFILYDALIDENLLKLARPGAGLIFAGKRAGVTSCKQSDISNLLADLAKKGNRCCG